MMRYETPSRPFGGLNLALLLFAGAMAALAVYLGIQFYRFRHEDPPKPAMDHLIVCIWAAANALISGMMVLRQVSAQRSEEGTSLPLPAKVTILVVGGVLGFTTVLMGIAFVHEWWDILTAGRLEWKKTKPWIPVGLIVAGLAAMFASLLVVRSEERTNVHFRRLIYGYNTVLTGLLVLATLGVGNVMAFFYAAQPFDWTTANIYSVSPQTKQILQSLDKPVKVYVILPGLDMLGTDLNTLLTTCKGYTNKLEVEFVTKQETLKDLFNKYEWMSGQDVLVVYDPDGKPAHQAIRREDLEELPSRFGEVSQRNFKGEQAIISAISNLRDGKVSLTVYVTQDSGEMSLSESAAPRRGIFQADRGLGVLRDKLQKSNYTVKEWQLGAIDQQTKGPAQVPDDAFCLIMAGPQDLGSPAVAAAKIKALEDYMKRPKAKLLLLLGAHRNRQGEVLATGLEGFLAKYGVQVGKDMIIHPAYQTLIQDIEPTSASTSLSPQADAAFREGFHLRGRIELPDTRTVQPGGDAGNYVVAPLLVTASLLQTSGGQSVTGQWAETNLRGSVDDFLKEFAAKHPDELTKKMTSPPATVAVTVRDKSTKPQDPQDPHAFMRQGQDGPPRMIVFGSSSMASNTFIEGAREVYYNLLSSSLAWLRDRPDLITDIQPKERKAYRLNIKPEESTRTKYLPVAALLIGITVCGVGVWLARRR